MYNRARFSRSNGFCLLRIVLLFAIGLLLAACAKQHEMGAKGKHNSLNNMSTIPASRCINNPYLQKYDCSVQRIEQAAQGGDPDAQYALGYIYYYGIGTTRNRRVAQSWINRAARQGQPLARKAQTLIAGGSELHSLHHRRAVGSARQHSHDSHHQTTRRPNPIQYAPTPSVDVLNSAMPDKPLNEVLPNYKKSGDTHSSGQPVINSLRKKSINQKPRANNEPVTKVEPLSQQHRAPSPPIGLSSSTKVVAKARQAITPAEHSMLNVPKKHYTLQLMSGRNVRAIQHFIKQNHLKNEAHYYSARFDHAGWYMLIIGDYATWYDAHMAIQQLPSALRSLHPWIKPYRVVHEQIRLRQVIS